MHAAVRVHAEHAALHGTTDPQRAREVVRPERTAQAVRRGIHLAEHLGLIVEGRDCHHWPENFLAPAAVALVHVEQDSRFEIEAFAGRTIAATGKLAAALAGVRQEFLDRRALTRGHQRTDLRRVVRWIANDQLARGSHELLDESFVDRALDEHPAACAAVLAGVGEHAHRRTFGRALPVAVGEDDVRRFAAEFE